MLLKKSDLRKAESDKYVAAHAKNFDAEAQQIWAEKYVPRKKELIEQLIISKFEYPKKRDEFRTKVRKTTTCDKLDSLVANIVMFAHGETVIK